MEPKFNSAPAAAVSRSCDAHRPAPVASTAPTGPYTVVALSKEEVREACGRVALAHRALMRCGEPGAARELAWVFELLERRIEVGNRLSGPPPA